MNNHSKLSLVLAEVDSVHFFTDAATGRSGISPIGVSCIMWRNTASSLKANKIVDNQKKI